MPTEKICELVDLYAKYAVDHDQTQACFTKIAQKLATKIDPDMVSYLLDLIRQKATFMAQEADKYNDDDDDEDVGKAEYDDDDDDEDEDEDEDDDVIDLNQLPSEDDKDEADDNDDDDDDGGGKDHGDDDEDDDDADMFAIEEAIKMTDAQAKRMFDQWKTKRTRERQAKGMHIMAVAINETNFRQELNMTLRRAEHTFRAQERNTKITNEYITILREDIGEMTKAEVKKIVRLIESKLDENIERAESIKSKHIAEAEYLMGANDDNTITAKQHDAAKVKIASMSTNADVQTEYAYKLQEHFDEVKRALRISGDHK